MAVHSSDAGKVKIDARKLKKAYDMLMMLNRGVSKSVMRVIAEGAEMPVSLIASRLRMDPAVASNILSKMEVMGLINSERRGKEVIHTPNIFKLDSITKAVKNI